MTEAEARAVLARSLEDVAPEVDAAALDPDIPLHDQIDLDSLDFLTFVEGVHDQTGIDIPERDYPLLATLASAAAYLTGRAG